MVGLNFDRLKGIISGTVTWPNVSGFTKDVVPRNEVTLRVKDGGQSDTMKIIVGAFYKKLNLSIPSSTKIQVTGSTKPVTAGEPINPVDLISYVTGGKPFNIDEAKTTGYRPDYEWSIDGLPAGLYIDDGVIKGTYLGEYTGGHGTVTVTDALGQVASSEINFVAGAWPLIFSHLDYFDPGYIEQGYDITPVDLSPGVSGGVPWVNDANHPKGYIFSLVAPYPNGIQIDSKTGVLSGRPTSYDESNPQGTITVRAEDKEGFFATVTLVYEIIPQFVFDLKNPNILMPNGTNGVRLGYVFEATEDR